MLDLGPDTLKLAGPRPRLAERLRRFVRDICRRTGWRDNSDGAAWPFPRPGHPGDLLAGTEAALRRHIRKRLRKTRLHYLYEDPERQHIARQLLQQHYELLPDPGPGTTADLLLLTPQCWRELPDDPAWYHEQLRKLHREYPQLGVLVLPPADGTPIAINMAALIKQLAVRPEEPEAGIETSGPNL